MVTDLTSRSEILFIYDITDANPNGDPLDGNKPRIDEETRINIVTDVRLKRTVREYLYEYKGYDGTGEKDIFVREKLMDENKHEAGIQDGKTRAKDFIDKNDILKKCIDVRLFGGVIPLEGKKSKKLKSDEDNSVEESGEKSYTFTGPVQFKMGRSLHPVEMLYIKGTGAFASKPGNTQKTFREEYILPYSFIAFHGIINEKAAGSTGLTQEDVGLLLEGLWMGTKNLISRSKFGQAPRFLLKVDYQVPGYFLGDLDKLIKLNEVSNPLSIRSITDFKLDITQLCIGFENIRAKIVNVQYKFDERLSVIPFIPEWWKPLTI